MSKANRKDGAASPGSSGGKRRPHSIHFTQPSLARPSFKDECDINRIVDRFTQTGLLPSLRSGEPQYGDAPDSDFFTAARIAAELKSQAEYEAHFAEPSETASEDPEPSVTPSEGETTDKTLQDDTAPQDAAPDEQSG